MITQATLREGPIYMSLSYIGDKMAQASGLRRIMDDIAITVEESGQAEWLNLSIGNPAALPEVVAMWQGLLEKALISSFKEASCQYGPSRGTSQLVRAISDYFNRRYDWDISAKNIIIGPGSQMLCFIAAALHSGRGATRKNKVIFPAMPEYTGYQGVCLGADDMGGVASTVEKLDTRRFRYDYDFPAVADRDDVGMILVSSPCNPTGRCISGQELDRLIEIAEQRDVPLMIDHAYGEPFPQIVRTSTPPLFHPQVINCFSLSKAGLPGERIGFAIGPESLIAPMVSFLSNSALHAPRLTQLAVAEGLCSGQIDDVVSEVISPFYSARRSLAEELLLKLLPVDVSWRLHANEGGMFAWIWVDEDWFNDIVLYDRLKADHVFITPGRYFFASGHQNRGSFARHSTRCFRITLTVSDSTLAEGIRRIGGAIGELKEHSGTVTVRQET